MTIKAYDAPTQRVDESDKEYIRRLIVEIDRLRTENTHLEYELNKAWDDLGLS